MTKELIVATKILQTILRCMDMFTGDMENWLNEAEVQDTRHAELLRDILQSRDFLAHDDASNIQYAFEMTKWVANHFEYLTYAASDEIEGDVLPTPLKALIAHEWTPGGELHVVYPPGSQISIDTQSVVYDHQKPTTLESIIGELITEGRSFEQVLADTKSFMDVDKDLMAEQKQKKLDSGPAIEIFTVTWTHPLSHNSGIDILARDNYIQAVPHGTPEYMQKLFPFGVELNKDPSEVASILSELAVLGAEHCPPRSKNYFTDRLDIENFAVRLKRI